MQKFVYHSQLSGRGAENAPARKLILALPETAEDLIARSNSYLESKGFRKADIIMLIVTGLWCAVVSIDRFLHF